MSGVIAFPPVARRPRAVADTPAKVVSHPRSIGEPAANAIEQIERDRDAEHAMAEAHRELDLFVLELSALAAAHGRSTQAVTMVAMALKRMKFALR